MPSASITPPDITLTLDSDGTIRDAALSDTISREGLESWRGRRWQDTVAAPGGDNIRAIVEGALASGLSAFRQVLQRFPSGLELPMEFTTVRIDGRNGDLLAIGKNLQAVSELQSRLIATQQAREQEYWKLREVETRYRLLFDAATEAVLLVRADNFQVIEANPAAIRALDIAPGWEFLRHVPPQERAAFESMIARVREHGRAPGIVIRLGARREPWALRASLMAADPGPLYLLHLAPVGAATALFAPPPAEPVRAAPSADAVSVDALIERLPDGFVVIDGDSIILRANEAFAALVQVGGAAAVIAQPVGRWLSRPGSDIAVVLATLQRHKVVRLLATTIHGELGGATEVEISATDSADARPRLFGLLFRDVGRRMSVPGEGDELSAILRAASQQIGRTPLLQVVRGTADAMERHYIKGALEIAGGNRTAAAELLGLSRQSLHTKLNRYGFEAAGAGALAAPD